MLVKAGGVVGLGVAVLVLAACGSTSYSVGRVESAFAAHGIPLAVEPSPGKGEIELANFSDRVEVLFGGWSGRLGPVVYVPSSSIPPAEKTIRQGDLTVYVTAEHADAVQASLRQLRH